MLLSHAVREQLVVGGITNTNARCLQLDCSFLSSDKKYIATIYTDDVEVPGKIKITTRKITLKTKLSFMLQRSGGFFFENNGVINYNTYEKIHLILFVVLPVSGRLGKRLCPSRHFAFVGSFEAYCWLGEK